MEPTASGRRGLMAGFVGVENSEGSARVYGWGTVLILRARPGVNSYFIEWSGDCTGTSRTTELTMDGNKTCTANFGYPVGGIAVPMDRLEVLVPWMGLVGLGALVALTVVLVRRRRS